jgi:hypothetical protein
MAKQEKAEKSARGSSMRETASVPEVIVDFIFDDGLFFVAVENIGQKPALKVAVRFDKKILGLGGSSEISALPLFQNIEFMAPRKQIVTFLDSSASYFGRNEPTKISAKISYRDSEGKEFQTIVQHDLEIYRDISYIPKSESKKSLPTLG